MQGVGREWHERACREWAGSGQGVGREWHAGSGWVSEAVSKRARNDVTRAVVVTLATPHPAKARFRGEGKSGRSCGVRLREFRPEKCEIDDFHTFPQKIVPGGVRLRNSAVRHGVSHHFPKILSGTTAVQGVGG
jgi:hypothetical protein